MKKCKCGGKIGTYKSIVYDLYPDPEPFEADVIEHADDIVLNDGFQVIVLICVKCNKIHNKIFDELT